MYVFSVPSADVYLEFRSLPEILTAAPFCKFVRSGTVGPSQAVTLC